MPEAIEEPYGSGNTKIFVVSGSLRGPVGLFYTSAFIDLPHLRGGGGYYYSTRRLAISTPAHPWTRISALFAASGIK